MTCIRFMSSRLLIFLLGLCCLWFSAEEAALQARGHQGQVRVSKPPRANVKRQKLSDRNGDRRIHVEYSNYTGRNQQPKRETLANPHHLSQGHAVFTHTMRIQAQGGGLEKSVTIQKNGPITRREVHLAMSALAERLTSSEQKLYRPAFIQASKAVKRISANGGIIAAESGIQGLMPKGNRTAPVSGRQVRVDVNNLRGDNLRR